MPQERISRSHETDSDEGERARQEAIVGSEAVSQTIQTDDTDAILDMIEDVLEENAEEFVGAYRQKGGQ